MILAPVVKWTKLWVKIDEHWWIMDGGWCHAVIEENVTFPMYNVGISTQILKGNRVQYISGLP